MNRLRDEIIPEEELSLVRNFMIGSILGDLDGAFQVIQRWKNLILNDLDENYFYNNIRTIKTVSAEELQQLARLYLVPEDFYELIVIDARPTKHSACFLCNLSKALTRYPMLGILIRLLVTALAALLTAYLLPGVKLQDFTTALLLAIVLGLLNLIVKPILVILTLPVTVVTLGLFLLVINALIVLWASSLVKGFKVDNFWWALLFSVVLSLISSFMMSLGPEDRVD